MDFSNSNVDGNVINDKSNFYSPSKVSQSENIKLTLSMSSSLSTNGRIEPKDINYIEAHATGTPTGDPIETEAISMVFKDSGHSLKHNCPLLIGSIKSNIGHAESASGIASLIKCCIMYRYQCFVPNNHFNKPNPSIKFNEWNLKVVTEATPFPKDKIVSMLVSNYGITGSNVCVLLSDYSPFKSNNEKSISSIRSNNTNIGGNFKMLVPFSANSVTSLEKYQNLIIQSNQSKSDFNDFIYDQIHYKSTSLCQRSVIIASNWEEFNNKANHIKSLNDYVSNISIERKTPTVVFVFCGQGSQYNTMGLELYKSQPIFRESMDLLDKKLSNYYGYSILEKLRSIPNDVADVDKSNSNTSLNINSTLIVQPSLSILMVSLFKLYRHWGIEPSFIIGHSLGENIASYCSGMIDLDTFCYLVYHRSVAQHKISGTGRMLSINISSEQFKLEYSHKYPNIEIACYNSPTSIVIAGNEQSLLEIMEHSKKSGIFSVLLGSLSSFHTSSQRMIKHEILELNIQNKSPTIPTFSTVTTELFNEKTTPFNSEYVYENIEKPVLFQQTIANIYKHIESLDLGKDVVFIEISPHPTLSFYLNQMKPPTSNKYFNNGEESSISIYSALNRKKNDGQEFLKTISKLYCENGLNVNFKSQLQYKQFTNINHNYNNRNKKRLFNQYQWDDQTFWTETNENKHFRESGLSIDHIGIPNISTPFKSYDTFIDIEKQTFQWLKGHQVKNKYIFPGCGYIDILLKLYPSQDLIIDSIEFIVPLVLIEGDSQRLQTVIYNTSTTDFKIINHFKEKKKDQWIQSSTGNFQLFKNSESNNMNEINYQCYSSKKFNIKDILSNECNLTKLSKNELYSRIYFKTDLNYTAEFKRVEKCYLGEKCSLAIIPLNFQYSKDLINTSINDDGDEPILTFDTPLVDSCLHGLLGLIENKNSILLEKIEGFKIHHKNIPTKKTRSLQHDNIYIYSKFNYKVKDSESTSVAVMLSDGTVIMEIESVVCRFLESTKDPMIIENPSDEIFIPFFQLKDSPIQLPYNLNYLGSYENNKERSTTATPQTATTTLYGDNFVFCIIDDLKSYLNERSPTFNEEIKTLDIDQLKRIYCNSKTNYKHERLFSFIFELLKNSNGIKQDKTTLEINYPKEMEHVNRVSKILAKLLIPLSNDDDITDTPQSLFQDGFMDYFYSNQSELILNHILISKAITKSIETLLNEKMVFRILEFGSGTSALSIIVLKEIIFILMKENRNCHQIDIQYTWSDVSAAFILDAKEKLSKFIKNHTNVNLEFKVIDLEQSSLTEKYDLKPSKYDFIIMSNVIHVVKNVRNSLNEIYKLLTPNGHLLFVEPVYRSIYIDFLFGIFEQWWAFEDTDLRIDRCSMKRETWVNLLSECNFKDTITSNGDFTFIIHTRKPSIFELSKNSPSLFDSSYDQIIIFSDLSTTETITNKNSNDFTKQIKLLNNNNQINKIKEISSIEQFKQLEKTLTNNSIILFTKTMNQLNLNNFKDVTLEFIEINKSLLKNKLNCKNILVSVNSHSNNYLSSSVIGVIKYLYDFPQIQVYNFDFDSISIENNNSNNNSNMISIIQTLINSNQYYEKEFHIMDNKIYCQRYKKETKFKNKYISNSFETEKQRLTTKFSITNLEYELSSKVWLLNDNEVEVNVKGTSINYRDYLITSGLISTDSIYSNKNTTTNTQYIAYDFSAVVSRVGKNVKDFKVGDSVLGICYGGDKSTHAVVGADQLLHKPNNINFQEASIVLSIYLSSFISIYSVGNLKSNESILIHSATGGVGLSSLNILKWKAHKSFIFCTVGSEEKEQYLRDTYGDFITGIYSSRNKQYPQQIKQRLKELGSNQNGVHLIINTLSSKDLMNSNFKCLDNQVGGRIVDLSITHLNNSEYINNSKFKYNVGYHNVDISGMDKVVLLKSIGKSLLEAIENGELSIKMPITEFSNKNSKDAIFYINERKHIGKIVINNDYDHLDDLLKNDLNINDNYSILKSNYRINESNIGKNIIITGQVGIILEILKWIIKFSDSVENIIILSKSLMKWELEMLINKTKKIKPNLKFHFKSIDIGNSDQLNQSIDEILNDNLQIENIESIFHFAFSATKCFVEEISMEHLDVSHGAKTMGSINLHNQQLKRGWKLINFVMASSVTSIIGSENQCSYVSACNTIDSFSKYRRSLGLPSICVNYGIINLGFVERNRIAVEMTQDVFLSTNQILGSLDLQIQNQNHFTNSIVCKNCFLMNSSQSDIKFSKFNFNNNNNDSNKKLVENGKKEMVMSKISEFLSISESKINSNLRLLDYGIDSLVIIQIKNWIDREFKKDIVTIQQLQTLTIASTIQILW
ncbi:hypothetical protein RB653_003499 [Dictyostelium firmibasis]|uniref:Carrier domain-containing protein n=1 Tax=Dictyostelium firmibasis TaxID=79012 RepID=A0AAN7TXT5_9MYCE